VWLPTQRSSGRARGDREPNEVRCSAELFDLLLQQTDLVVHLLALLLLLLQTLLQDEDGLLIPLQSPLQQLDLLGSRRGPVAVVR
jgi:hypothetical protein